MNSELFINRRIDVEDNGDVKTYLNNKLHSFDDEPSYVSADGTIKKWSKNGQLHRDNDLPSSIVTKIYTTINNKEVTSITEQWYIDGNPQREKDKPTRYQKDVYRNFYTPSEITYVKEISEWHNKNSYRHRDGDKPAYVEKDFYYKEGKITRTTVTEKWFQNDKKHRDEDEPAFVFLSQALNLNEGEQLFSREEMYYKNDQRHRDNDKPAVTLMTFSNINNEIKEQQKISYYKNDMLHREGDKPANLKVSIKNGIEHVEVEQYYLFGKEHRDGDLPSTIRDEERVTIRYCLEGKLHRVNAPSLIVIKKDSFYFGFHENDKENSQCHSFFSEIILKRLKVLSPEDFKDIKVGDYPVAQLSSILFTLSGENYSSNILKPVLS